MNLQQLLPKLVPPAIAWAKRQELAILKAGSPLCAVGIAIAQDVGVKAPQHVRLLIVPAIPRMDDPLLAQVAAERELFGPHTGGVALGHGIFLVEGKWNDRLVAHELRHVQQYETLGGIEGFMPVYLAQIARYGYKDAPLEQDARRAAGEPV